ncbi:MAG: 4Fe-4S binding protein [Dehalococcoidia bacterium]
METIDPIYRELAAKLGLPNSQLLPRILAKLADLEQAKIIRELPSTPQEIAGKLNIDVQTVERHIRELFEKGVIFYTKKGPQLARSLMQLHDAALCNPKYDEMLGNEFFDLFAALMNEEIGPVAITEVLAGAGSGQPMMRIIPRWKSIKDLDGVLPCEDVREIIKSQSVLALVPCCCKREYRQRQCGTPTNSCISIGKTAQYNIDRGAGKKMTAEEALKVIDECDDYPLIHVAPNQTVLNQVFCNCHSCCCGFLHPVLSQTKFEVSQAIAKSRFEVTVDAKECIQCGICAERCQFKANSLERNQETGEECSKTDIDKCLGCGACVTSCPSGARKMKLVRPPEHIPGTVGGIY